MAPNAPTIVAGSPVPRTILRPGRVVAHWVHRMKKAPVGGVVAVVVVATKVDRPSRVRQRQRRRAEALRSLCLVRRLDQGHVQPTMNR